MTWLIFNKGMIKETGNKGTGKNTGFK